MICNYHNKFHIFKLIQSVNAELCNASKIGKHNTAVQRHRWA